MSSSPPVDPSCATTTTTTRAQGYWMALLRTLQVAGVKYIRYQALDVVNSPRIKCIPITILLQKQQQKEEQHVQFASVALGGLPSFGDYMQKDSGIDARGMVVLEPDFSTFQILPYATTTGVVLGNLHDIYTGEISYLCCRSLLQGIIQKAKMKYQIGFNVGVELEFTLYYVKTNQPIDATNFAHSQLLNEQQDFIAQLYEQLEQQGIVMESIHGESGPGQLEVILQYCNDPVIMSDRVLLTRETICGLAWKHGLKALFVPKIDPMKAGNGCHLHLSIYDKQSGQNLFEQKTPAMVSETTTTTTTTTDETSGISDIGKSFMEGILTHLPALLGLSLPTTNSFRRVGPGCWTGSSVDWSFDDKESPIRVVASPVSFAASGTNSNSSSSNSSSTTSMSWNHFEYKLCDNTANLYLALAGILASGLSGVENKSTLRPHRYNDKNDKNKNNHNDSTSATFPTTVEQSLDALEKDELMKTIIPERLLKAYLSVRRAEAERGSKMTLEDEVQEALTFAGVMNP